MHLPITISFLVYLVLVLGLGVLAYRRTRNLADYILGGRRLNRWVTALSAQASDMSGWLLLGLPGYAYLSGLESVWLALGLFIGTWLNWRMVAARLRRYTELADNALTLPDYLEARFMDASRLLRVVSALFILAFFLVYTASGLVAGGKLFSSVFELPYEWAVLVGAAVVVLYTFLGGFLAVSWTDALQASLMLLALVLVPLTAINAMHGVDASLAAIQARNPALLDLWTNIQGEALGLVAILSLLAWGLGYFGQPHILARFMAVRDVAELVPARRIAMLWVGLCLVGAVWAGLAGIGYLQPALAEVDAEKVFIHLVRAMLHPLVAGVCLAAILAAIMSTADSQLLVSSSVLVEDFYRRMLRPSASERELVWSGRVAVVLIALLALSQAMDPESSVLELVAYAWAGFGATFGPVVLLSLYWPRMTRNGALAGLLAGGLAVVAWRHLDGGIFELYEILPGVLAAASAVVLVSLLDQAPNSAVQSRYRTIKH